MSFHRSLNLNKPILLYSIDYINYYFLIFWRTNFFLDLFDSKLLKFKNMFTYIYMYCYPIVSLIEVWWIYFFMIGLTQGSDTCQPVNRTWCWKIPNTIKSPLRSLIRCDVIDFMDEEACVVSFCTFIPGEIRFTYLFPILDTMLIGGKNYSTR